MKTMSLERMIACHGAIWILLTICGNMLDFWIADPFWVGFWSISSLIWPLLMLAALIHIPLRCKTRRWNCLRPLASAILTVGMVCGAVSFELASRLEWVANRNDFERVVQMVERGELKTNRQGFIRLPSELRHLSHVDGGNFNQFDGQVLARRHGGRWTIFFATKSNFDLFTGVDGFAYRAGAKWPTGLELGANTDDVSIIFQPAKNWFCCRLRPYW